MPSRRFWLSLVAVLAFAAQSFAQITWNFTYQDVVQNNGIGFADPTVDPGQTLSRGQLRQDSITAATVYLNTILDGRGTINAGFDTSLQTGSGFLAAYGPSYSSPNFSTGQFNNGQMYRAGRAGNVSGNAGSGQFNFGYGWNYAGQNGAPSGSRYDMVTVAIHEITHGLGFLSLTNPNGSSEFGGGPNSPATYSGFDRFLQRGNGPLNSTSRLFNTDITNAGYGSFTGNASTLTNNNDPTTGLFFGGAFAREVYGGAVPLYAPNSYQSGSSTSHVNDSTAVMNPFVGANQVKRYRPYEIAMMMDIGWNVYNWNAASGTGNWADGINGTPDSPTSYTLANSRWRTDSGIISGGGTYNTFNNPAPAPVLPVYGQTTANIVLNFSNTGSTAYTSTNNFGNAIRLSRLTFTSTDPAGTINIAGGTLNFGLNANGSASVLVPKIQQNGSGAVNISSTIQTNTIATQTVDGVQFAGHTGVTVEGTGSGLVTISGNITGNGGLTKNSNSFNLVLTGTNTYTGTTAVNAGSLFVNGNSSAATGAVSVNGGTLTGTGTVGGAVTVNSGGALEGGNGGIGTLAVANNVTVNSGGILRAQLGASTADQINMTGGSYVLDLKNGAVVSLVGSGFNSTPTTYMLADLNGTGNFLRLNGTDVAADTDLNVFTSTGGSNGTNSNGNLTISLSGINLAAGDRFTLRRDSFGDLVLVFTPVPEPAGILVICGLISAGGLAWRRWAKRPAPPTTAC